MSAAAAAFVVPALYATGGPFPVPLDDSYIYFAHARAVAEGAAGAWIAGQGYSSGATAIGYPFLLAPFWLVGLRGSALGAAAIAIAIVCVIDLARSLAKLHAAWWIAPLVVCVPLLGWSLWSGMEVALFAALFGRALVAVWRQRTADVRLRRTRQLAAGGWLAAMVLTRPESLPLAVASVVAVVWSARSLSTVASLVRAGAPLALALSLRAGLQHMATGEWMAAGAIRKGLWVRDLPSGDIVVAWLQNLAVVLNQVFLRAFGGLAGAALFLGLLGVAVGRRARLALPLVFGLVFGLGLICANATARFQNYRYTAPLVLMVLALALLGISALPRKVAPVVAALVLIAPSGQWRRQIDHFARASANIAEQHLEVARRIDALAPGPLFVNDAGAIPYLTGRRAIDGLGLGGYCGLPFARASIAGVPAVVELIERLPQAERPRWLAIYPSWWPGLVPTFGRRVDAVRIDDNVICGASEKVIYAADWSLLEVGAEGLDVGDLVDERRFAHDGSGLVIARHDGQLWDAGRSYAAGERERFAVMGEARMLESRTDGAATLVVSRLRGEAIGMHREVQVRGEGFHWVRIDLGDARAGDRVVIEVVGGVWRSFHHRFSRLASRLPRSAATR